MSGKEGTADSEKYLLRDTYFPLPPATSKVPGIEEASSKYLLK